MIVSCQFYCSTIMYSLPDKMFNIKVTVQFWNLVFYFILKYLFNLMIFIDFIFKIVSLLIFYFIIGFFSVE